jgi:hypothetical protein
MVGALFKIGCFGKQQFRSVQLAHLAAARRPGRNIYKCRACGYWHVGNRRQKPRRKRRGTSDGQRYERF